jgi:hypothetical protein
VLARLKIFLGLDPSLPKQDLVNPNDRAAAAGGEAMRVEQYRVLQARAAADGEAVAALLTQYGVADGAAFLTRWRAKWAQTLDERCDAAGDCLISSH